MRRKRNLIARDLKTNPLYKPKVVELGKIKRAKKLTLKDIDRILEEEGPF